MKSWYRTGNYDVNVFEQEYLEMIHHWERLRPLFVNLIDKQKITLVFLPGLTADHMHYPDHLRIITVCLTWQNGLIKS